jgi:hypothetical protein
MRYEVILEALQEACRLGHQGYMVGGFTEPETATESDRLRLVIRQAEPEGAANTSVWD